MAIRMRVYVFHFIKTGFLEAMAGFCSIYYVTGSISKYFPLDEMLSSPSYGYHPAFTCCSSIYTTGIRELL